MIAIQLRFLTEILIIVELLFLNYSAKASGSKLFAKSLIKNSMIALRAGKNEKEALENRKQPIGQINLPMFGILI